MKLHRLHLLPVLFTGFLLLFAITCLADGDQNQDVKTSINGSGSYEFGQIVRGWDKRSESTEEPCITHVWQQRLYMQLGFSAIVKERAKITLAGEGLVTYSWAKQQEFYETVEPKFHFYPHHVEGCYSFFGLEKPYLEVGVGLFPYKYNPEVRNLGEFLFRTGTYPGYIINEFDFPLKRLLGFRVSSTLFENLRQDIMLISEPYVVPLQDFGLSYLLSYSIGKILNVGGGIFFDHLWSVNPKYTTPEVPQNMIIDTSTGETDSSYYTFKGTKVMARLTFDPKGFFKTDIFGENDLKFYAEWAIIGLKDYPVHYNDIDQRMPFMIGFNFPAFKIFDVLALEMEWYHSPYPNSYANVYQGSNLPLPYIDPRMQDVINYDRDDLKWSIYVAKELAGCFEIIGQAAFDHVHMTRHDDREQDREEVLRRPGDWHYRFKFRFGF